MDEKITVKSAKLKTIVMVVQALPPMKSGGAEIQALRIAERLKADGIDVIFITPGEGKIKGYSVMKKVPVYRLHSPLNYIVDLLLAFKKNAAPQKTTIEFDDEKAKHNIINRKIGFGARLRYNVFLLNAYFFLKKRKERIEVLHSHTIEWPGYVAAVLSKRLNKKLLIKDSTMNGIFSILRFPDGEKKRQLIIRQAQFVAMTKAIEDNLLKAGVAENRITHIPNGIEIDSSFKTDYTLTGQVLFVGNLYQQPAKGVDILLKAWTIVNKKQPLMQLLIAGEGDLAAYEEYVNKLGIEGSVQFLGRRSDTDTLMLQCDVFVLPSRREGMPNVLMEAMLRAVPCVATDISGSQDLIVDGLNGRLVPVADAPALAEKIEFLITQRVDAQKMGIAARQTIIDNYNISDIARKYAELYRKI